MVDNYFDVVFYKYGTNRNRVKTDARLSTLILQKKQAPNLERINLKTIMKMAEVLKVSPGHLVKEFEEAGGRDVDA